MMLHLLTQTTMFVRLPNDCLCQIAGTKITELTSRSANPEPALTLKTGDPKALRPHKRAGELADEGEQQRKRQKLDAPDGKTLSRTTSENASKPIINK